MKRTPLRDHVEGDQSGVRRLHRAEAMPIKAIARWLGTSKVGSKPALDNQAYAPFWRGCGVPLGCICPLALPPLRP